MGNLEAPKPQEGLAAKAEVAQKTSTETFEVSVDAIQKTGELAVEKEVLVSDPHAKALAEAGFEGIQLKKAEKNKENDRSTYEATLDHQSTQVSIQLTNEGAKVELTTYDPVSVITSKGNGDRELAAEIVPHLIENVVANYRKSRS